MTSKEVSVSASASGVIKAIAGKVSVDAKFASIDTEASTTTNTSLSNASRSDAASVLSKAMDRHVTQSSAARKVEVNTENQTTSTTTAGEENSTIRELENINRSRVLNFVVRQLNQEYLTITSLSDVSFGFTRGYLGDGREEKLSNLDGLLADVIKPEFVAQARSLVLKGLNNIYDYQDNPHSFIERVERQITDVTNPQKPAETEVYYRRRLKDEEGQELTQEWAGKKVPGIILDTARRILTTDAVVVEALLGQGEALDCYNQRLQDAAVERASLINQQQESALQILNAINDPNEKAIAFNTIFNTTSDKNITINLEKPNA
jgi:hypothetical protein